MTKRTVAKAIEAEIALQEVPAEKKAEESASGSLPTQFNDACKSEFLTKVRLAIWEAQFKAASRS